ncbi:two-component system activity regulator YycH [Alicyclobacillus kakegawensis]|uniref:two-component system activity regulator YycH n=1 Tax=Alicyclobacillus kakegawensis TaxID=392012 RepID=UPI00082F7164|nr:two-component system activity regulator YycH [Alicyclobacillus kakegawensis]
MTAKRLQTLVLSVLVLISLVLSYLLWRGAWLSSPEPGLTAPTVRDVSPYPQVDQVLGPVEVDVQRLQPAGAALVPIGSAVYRQWVGVLHSLKVERLRRESAPPAHATVDIVFHFGLELTRSDISRWLPALRLSPLDVSGDTMELYQMAADGPVLLMVTGGSDGYTAETDVDRKRFAELVAGSVQRYPAVVWQDGQGDTSYLPAQGMEMERLSVSVDKPPLLPLVHSFFVNPGALTRIQESRRKVIWTDGTRAVQWDPEASVLTFDDPNTSAPATEQTELQTVISYIRSHGGAPSGDVLFDSDDSAWPGMHTYQLRPQFAGYVVFGSRWTQKIEVDSGQVVHYQRPLGNLTAGAEKQKVTVMGASELREVLRDVAPKTRLSAYTARLGYWAVPDGDGQMELEPAFAVWRDGVSVGVIDAVSGQVLEGMKRP